MNLSPVRFSRWLADVTAIAMAGYALAAAPATTASTAPAAKPVTVDLRRMMPIHGDAAAGAGKAAVCAACHGANGVAIAPNFPNLAGQSATYLYVQLKAFKDGQRSDPVMTGQAAPLSDQDMRDLAAHFAALAPKPGAAQDAGSRGARLYANGDPASGAPPCQACHGADGRGPRPSPGSAPQPPWSTYPSLAGQPGVYVTKQLQDFHGGTRSGNTNARVMTGVAQTLSDADIQALAGYIETL